MFWNHRVLKRIDQGETVYGIVEAFYDNDGELDAYGEAFEAPSGESVEELRQSLRWMLDSVEAPVLDEAELSGYFEKRRLAGKGLAALSAETVPFDPGMFDTTDEI